MFSSLLYVNYTINIQLLINLKIFSYFLPSFTDLLLATPLLATNSGNDKVKLSIFYFTILTIYLIK